MDRPPTGRATFLIEAFSDANREFGNKAATEFCANEVRNDFSILIFSANYDVRHSDLTLTSSKELQSWIGVTNNLLYDPIRWRTSLNDRYTQSHVSKKEYNSSIYLSGAARTQPQLPKIMHPKQPQFADVANVSPSKCYDGPLLGRSSFLIKDDSSARSLLEEYFLEVAGWLCGIHCHWFLSASAKVMRSSTGLELNLWEVIR
ncbi:hypothetical protein CEXT_470421 [Caerostris extrusa]|uniref:Uncharacterized protein n=4 Tax=Caerostris TaxID=172845 RepID=A0AAV4XWT2_CAEEX|nr:hypothetical protein CEXT_470421 [Caerostris extrusa]